MKLPLRVRLSNAVPLARSSWLQAPKKISPLIISPLSLVLELLLLPLPHIPIPMPLSIGVTAVIFHTSFNALAFKVAAPRRAAHIKDHILQVAMQREKYITRLLLVGYYLSKVKTHVYNSGTKGLINNGTIDPS